MPASGRVNPLSIRLLHAATGTLAVAVAALGLWLLNPPAWTDPMVERYLRWIGHHQAGGLMVLVLTLAWAGARIRFGFASIGGSGRADVLARAVHLLLLALLAVVPASGLLMQLHLGGDLRLAGFAIPSFLPRNDAANIAWARAHQLGAWLLIGCVLVHLSAALGHAIRGDGALAPMIPRRRTGGRPSPR